MLVDFHCHTEASDGSLSAAALLDSMRARGVGHCSITDHDTVAAYDALAAGARWEALGRRRHSLEVTAVGAGGAAAASRSGSASVSSDSIATEEPSASSSV